MQKKVAPEKSTQANRLAKRLLRPTMTALLADSALGLATAEHAQHGEQCFPEDEPQQQSEEVLGRKSDRRRDARASGDGIDNCHCDPEHCNPDLAEGFEEHSKRAEETCDLLGSSEERQLEAKRPTPQTKSRKGLT